MRDPGRLLAVFSFARGLDALVADPAAINGTPAMVAGLQGYGPVRLANDIYVKVRAWLLRCINRRKSKVAPADLGPFYNALGYLCDDMQAYELAVKHYESALRVFQQQPERHKLALAAVLNNLGAANSNLGQNAAAITRYEEALSLLRKCMGADHPSVATTYTNLGDAYVAKD